MAESDITDAVEVEDITDAVIVEDVTDAVLVKDATDAVVVDPVTDAVVVGDVTDTVGNWLGRDTEAVEVAGLAMAAWWQAARFLFFSISAGPRWRGRRGGRGGLGGRLGDGEEGRPCGAPGWPRGQLKPTVAWPLEVVRLREAVPPKAQTEMNSFTDAMTNWELSLDDIFEEDTEVELLKVAGSHEDHLVNLNLFVIFECQRHIRKFFVAWQICCREGGPSSQSLGPQLRPVDLSGKYMYCTY